VLSGGLGQVADNGGVGVEQICPRQRGTAMPLGTASHTITGHSGLAGNTSGDNDDLSALEGLGELGGSGIVAADLRCISRCAQETRSVKASYLALGVDVANVGSDT
jgi:hypothetical protein